MTVGKPFEEGDSAPGSAEDDATLDIVRLLIETETRHAETHQGRSASAEGGAGGEPAAGRVAPRRVTLHGKPKLRGRHVPQEALSAGELEFETADAPEDLRPRRFGLRMPRLKMPRILTQRAGQMAPQKAGRMTMDRKRLVRAGKLAALAGAVLLVWFKPWLIPLLLFIVVWLALIVFLLLGSARISELLERGWAFYQARRPAKAAQIIARLQKAADRLDGILARMPERLADGIFTPDLGRSARDMAAENRPLPENDPFERLTRGRQPAE